MHFVTRSVFYIFITCFLAVSSVTAATIPELAEMSKQDPYAMDYSNTIGESVPFEFPKEVHGDFPNIVTPNESDQVLTKKQAVAKEQVPMLMARQLAAVEAQTWPTKIVELARSLKNNPARIYEFVHNKIEFEPYYGLKKGAFGTLLSKSANSFDQSALMVALLQASGYTARFVRGIIELPGPYSSNLLSIKDNIYGVVGTLANAGIPIPKNEDGSLKASLIPNTTLVASVQFEHVWVEAEVNGKVVVFDPSCAFHDLQTESEISGILNYDKASFLQAALEGATVSPKKLSGVSRTNIHEALNTYTSKLTSYLNENQAVTTGALIGKASSTLPLSNYSVETTALSYQKEILNRWDNIPDQYKSTMRVQYPGIDKTFDSEELSGHSLTLSYDQSLRAVLKLDGQIVATGSPLSLGSSSSLTLTVNHPYAANNGTFGDQEGDCSIKAGGIYSIVNRWGRTGEDAVAHHQNLLATTLADTTKEKQQQTEQALALVGYNYLAEISQAESLIEGISDVKILNHHQAGVTGYYESVYIDLPLGNNSLADQHSVNFSEFTPQQLAAFKTHGLFSSVLESGVVKQTQGIEALSTVRIFDYNSKSSATNVFYLLNTANYSQYKAQLVNYSSNDLTAISKAIAEKKHVLLPKNGKLTVDEWSGSGYIAYLFTTEEHSGQYKISGGFNGGYSSSKKPVSNSGVSSLNRPPLRTGISSYDPIDLATGSYYYDATDLTLGSNEKNNLSFKRNYNCQRKDKDSILGKGWTHSFDVMAERTSNAFLGLGEGSPKHSAAAIVAFYVCNNILQSNDISEEITASLVQGWLMDQLTDNVVTVTEFNTSYSFAKQPDGSYFSPQGRSDTLTVTDAEYHVKTKHGKLSIFDKETGRLKEIRDLYGNAVTSTLPPASTCLKEKLSGSYIIQNAFGKALTVALKDGRATTVTDNGGRQIAFAYDSKGNLTQFTDVGGEITKYEYDLPGRLTKIFYPSRPTSPYVVNVYDELDKIKTQTNANGKTYSYSFSGYRTEETDPLGNTRYWIFNEQNQPVKEVDAKDIVTTYQYDGYQRVTKRAKKKNDFSYTYDAAGNAIQRDKVRYGNDSNYSFVSIEKFTYHPTLNKILTHTDALGGVTTYVYNTQGDVLSKTFPTVAEGTAVARITYTNKGLISSETDPTGVVKSYTYDTVTGDRTAVTNGSGGQASTSSFVYDAVGNVVRKTDAKGVVTSYAYDSFRRCVSETTAGPYGLAINYVYDHDGNLTELRQKAGLEELQYIEAMEYSSTGKKLRRTKRLQGDTGPARTTTYNYDDADQLVRVTDGEGRAVTYTYDSAGKLTKKADGEGNIIEGLAYYTLSGRLGGRIDGNGKMSLYRYGSQDESTVFPDGSSVKNSFDANGNVVSQKLRDNTTMTATYDARNLLRKRVWPDGEQQNFAYDLAGRLITASNAEGTIQREYNALGRLVQESFMGKTLSFTHTVTGNVESITYSDGNVATYTYDELDRLTNVWFNDMLVASYTYDALSRRIISRYGNGIEAQSNYGVGSRPTSLNWIWNSGAPSVLLYSYDASGFLTKITSTNDRFDMRAQSVTSQTSTVNAANQLATVNGQTVDYTANGNLQNDVTQEYQYTSQNQLKAIPSRGLAFGYDALGRRVRKNTGDVTYTYLYAGMQVAEEHGPNGVRKFIYSTGVDDPICMVEPDGSIYYFHHDANKNVIALSNDAGAVVETYAYTPFGKPFVNEKVNTAPKSPLLFASRWYEPEACIYYYRARHYHPGLRRFLQPDPLGYEDGMNMYAYVQNNPMNYSDPSGTIALVPVIGAGLGAVYNGAINWDAWQAGSMTNLEYFSSIALGATTGALSTMGAGFTSSFAIGGLSTAANEAGNQWLRTKEVDSSSVLIAGLVGSTGSAIGVAGKSVGQNFIVYPKVETIPARAIYNYGNFGALTTSYIGSNLVDTALASPAYKVGK